MGNLYRSQHELLQIPANREIYREFYENRVVWRKIARKNAAKSVSCWTIPYKMKQGINSRRTGNLSSRAGNLQRLAGNCPPCAEDVEHQQGRMLGVVGPRDRPLWCDERSDRSRANSRSGHWKSPWLDRPMRPVTRHRADDAPHLQNVRDSKITTPWTAPML